VQAAAFECPKSIETSPMRECRVGAIAVGSAGIGRSAQFGGGNLVRRNGGAYAPRSLNFQTGMPSRSALSARCRAPAASDRPWSSAACIGCGPSWFAEVKFLTWTDDNLLRQVVYEGLREDKPAAEVRRPIPHPKPVMEGSPSRSTEAAGPKVLKPQTRR
jgi:hypothetical protein